MPGPGLFSGSSVVIDDMNVVMEPGDELRRRLPNGLGDVYRIDDPRFFDARGMPRHYQVKLSRKGSFQHGTGGHYINVTGPNARVNINSTDNSTNIVNSGDVFGVMRQAVKAGVADPIRRGEIVAAINEAEAARGSTGFTAAYQKIVSVAADHLGILLPFLPALTALLA